LANNLYHLTTFKTNPNLVESGGKTRWVKKVSERMRIVWKNYRNNLIFMLKRMRLNSPINQTNW
jgi:hypothetical protein